MIALWILACATPPTTGGTTDADADGWDDAVDCAPADPAVHPGAADAACDGIDADCDGDAGDAVACTDELGAADGRWVAQAGDYLLSAAVVDGRVWVGLPVHAGGSALFRLPGDGSGGGDPALGELAVSGTDADGLGYDLVPAPDADGDGVEDVWVVGGVVSLFSGAATGAEPGAAIASLHGAYGVYAAGDFDADGVGDVLTRNWSTTAIYRDGDFSAPALEIDNLGDHLTAADVDGDGHAEVLGLQRGLGRPVGVAVAPADASGVFDYSDSADATWITAPHDPQVLGAADFDGDGYGDVAVGSAHDDERDVWLLAGPIAPGMDVSDAVGHLTAYADAGLRAVDAVGDVDCDGDAELTVTWSDGIARRVTLAIDPMAGTQPLASLHAWRSEYPSDEAGDMVAGGDVDGDGCSDLVVTAPAFGNFGGDRSGAAYVLLGVP